MPNRSCLLTSPNNKDHTGAIVAITDAQVEALSSAAYHSEIGVLRRHHFALVQLLRAVSPDDATLRMLDQRARENGFVRAGSDEPLINASPEGATLR